MNFKPIVLTVLLVLLFMPVSATAATITCNSCSDCTNKINSAPTNTVVELTANILSLSGNTCINWDRDYVTFDCKNHLIGASQPLTGTDNAIIKMPRGLNNKIMNCGIAAGNADYGILVGGSTTFDCRGTTIQNNVIQDAKVAGIQLKLCKNTDLNTQIIGNSLENNKYGIVKNIQCFYDQSYVTRNIAGVVIDRNSITGSEYGIQVYDHGGTKASTTIQNNVVCNSVKSSINYYVYSTLSSPFGGLLCALVNDPGIGSNNVCTNASYFHDSTQQTGCASQCLACSPYCTDSTGTINAQCAGTAYSANSSWFYTCPNLPSAQQCSGIEENCCTGKKYSYEWCGSNRYIYNCGSGYGGYLLQDCGANNCLDNNNGNAACTSSIVACSSCSTTPTDFCKCPASCNTAQGTIINPGQTCGGYAPCYSCDATANNTCSCPAYCTKPQGTVINPGGTCDGFKVCASCDIAAGTGCVCPSGCVLNQGTTVNNTQTCGGLRDLIPPTVTISIPPASWQTASQQAQVSCTDNNGSCNLNSYRIYETPAKVLELHMDGNLNDDSGLNHGGVLRPGAAFSSGFAGSALEIFGSYGATIYASPYFSMKYGTIEAWIYLNTTQNDMRLISIDNDKFWIGVSLDGKIAASAWNSPQGAVAATSSSPAANYLNSWHHIKGVVTSTSIELFIDGVSQGSKTFRGIETAAKPPVSIGSVTFVGKIDEVIIRRHLNSCPALYANYTSASPKQISRHAFVCGAANDSTDNTGFSSPVEFRVDSTSPAGFITINSGAAKTNSTQVSLSVSYYDRESGTKDCRFSTDGTFDTEAWQSCAPQKTIDLGNVADGDRPVSFRVRNNANLESATASDSITIDRTPPSVTGMTLSGSQIIDTGEYSNKTTIWARGLTHDSDADTCEIDWGDGMKEQFSALEISRSHNYTSAGQKTAYYTCRDSAGNWQPNRVSDSIVIDIAPPVTTDNTQAGQKYGSSVTIQLTCQDPGSGCSITRYCVYDQGAAQCIPSIQGRNATLTCTTGTCNKYVRYYSTDLAGNAEAARQSNLIQMDANKPTCTMGQLPQYTNSQSALLTWSGSYPGGNVITDYRLEKSTDLTAWSLIEQLPATETSRSYSLPEGVTHYFRCTALDNNRNVQGEPSLPVSTTRDSAPPTVSLNPLSQWTKENSVQLSWVASDTASGMKCSDVKWNKDGGQWQFVKQNQAGDPAQCLSSSVNSIVFDSRTTTITDGQYNFQVIVQDNAGNTQASATVSTRVDKTGPGCSITQPALIRSTRSLEIIWSASDAGIGVSSADIQWSNDMLAWNLTPSGDNVPYLPTGTNSIQFTAPADGTYYFRCIGTDLLNNTGQPTNQTASITIDSTAPSVSLTHNSVAIAGTEFIIKAVIAEIRPNIKTVTLKYDSAVLQPANITNDTNSVTYTWKINIPDVVLSSQQHTLQLTVLDIVDNRFEATSSFLVVQCVTGAITACGNPGIGACRSGTRICTNGIWGACTGIVGPSSETCDGIDNDCDGQVDENLGTQVCGDFSIGICRTGNRACLNGTWGTCQGEVKPQAEICDSLDNNCNSVIDEGCRCRDGDTQRCGIAVGICTKGTQICGNGRWGPCEGETTQRPETCNQLDDDCDNEIDEGVCGQPDICNNGILDSGEDDIDCGGACPACSGTCQNGVQDDDEEGIDCGGSCPACEPPQFDWTLIIAGVIILAVLGLLIVYFKRHGKEFTWEELYKRWSPEEYEMEEENA